MTDRIAIRYSNPDAPDEPALLPGNINPIPDKPVFHGDVIEVDAHLADDEAIADGSFPWPGFELA